MRFRVLRLFLDGKRAAVFVHLHHAERARVIDIIAEHRRAAAVFRRLRQIFAQVVAVENIVAQNEADLIVSDEALANEKCVGNAPLHLLNAVGDVQAKLRAVSKELDKGIHFIRRHDDEDVADARLHQNGHRIVDQRLIIHGNERLADRERHRIHPRSLACGENDTFHMGLLLLKLSPSYRIWLQKSTASRKIRRFTQGLSTAPRCRAAPPCGSSRPPEARENTAPAYRDCRSRAASRRAGSPATAAFCRECR